VLLGRTRFSRTTRGLETSELSREAIVEALHEDFGLSEALVDAWVGCGGLDASLEPPAGAKPPAVAQRPPSQR
jgi:hypothetical protein